MTLMMSETEIILRQNEIIRKLSSIIDDVYLAYAILAGTEAADLPCIDEIQAVDEEIREIAKYAY